MDKTSRASNGNARCAHCRNFLIQSNEFKNFHQLVTEESNLNPLQIQNIFKKRKHRLRISGIPAKNNSNWSLIQSGAEVTDPGDLTEKELAERNVIYYRTTSTFWHYLFLFGTQLGDEVRDFLRNLKLTLICTTPQSNDEWPNSVSISFGTAMQTGSSR